MLPEHFLQDCKEKEDQSVREHTELVKEAARCLIALGCVPSDRIGELLLIACEYHDYGKVNEEFQKRIRKKYRFQESKEIAHNILSYFFLSRKEFDCAEDYRIVAAAVLYHHSYSDVGTVLRNQGALIDKLLAPFQEYVKTKKKVTT